jgi:hypothetical protein
LAIIVETSFEATGIESGWGQTVGSGNTIDWDASWPADPPPSAGSECLRTLGDGGGNDNVFARWDRGSGNETDVNFCRGYFRFDTEALNNGEGFNLFGVLQNFTSLSAVIQLVQTSGTPKLRLAYYDDGTEKTTALISINLDQTYLLEIKYDTSANEWEWKIDGVSQHNGSLTGVTRLCRYLAAGILGTPGADTGTDTDIYSDLLAWDDADWIGVPPLTLQDSVHTVTVDPRPGLTRVRSLSVQDSVHANTTDKPLLSFQGTLQVQDSVHVNTTGRPVVSSGESLVIQDVLHSNTTDNIILQGQLILGVVDSNLSQTTDNLLLSSTATLGLQDSLHTQIIDAPEILSGEVLELQDSNHTQTSELITTQGQLQPEVIDGSLDHTIDNIVLSQSANLGLQDTLHSVDSDRPDLSTSKTLEMQDSSHTDIVEKPTLSRLRLLSVRDSLFVNTTDTLTLSFVGVLQVKDTVHTVTLDRPILSSGETVVLQDSNLVQTSDKLILSGSLQLETIDSNLDQLPDKPTLSIVATLNVQDSNHTVTPDRPILISGASVVLQDSNLDQVSEKVSLSKDSQLGVLDSNLDHTSDKLSLVKSGQAAARDTAHTLTADNITLQGALSLEVQDSNLSQTSECQFPLEPIEPGEDTGGGIFHIIGAVTTNVYEYDSPGAPIYISAWSESKYKPLTYTVEIDQNKVIDFMSNRTQYEFNSMLDKLKKQDEELIYIYEFNSMLDKLKKQDEELIYMVLKMAA